MRKIILAISLLITVNANAEPLAFRDIALGISKDEAKESLGKYQLYDCNSFPFCDFQADIKGIFVKIVPIFSEDEKLETLAISYYSNHYNKLKGALIEKYGKPNKVTKSTLQNGFGAQFTSQICTWRFKDGVIRI